MSVQAKLIGMIQHCSEESIAYSLHFLIDSLTPSSKSRSHPHPSLVLSARLMRG